MKLKKCVKKINSIKIFKIILSIIGMGKYPSCLKAKIFVTFIDKAYKIGPDIEIPLYVIRLL